MSDRYITIPPDAKFVDPVTKDQVRQVNPEWRPTAEQPQPGTQDQVDMADKSFEWFLHVFILSHRLFSMDYGGYDAVKAMKQIGKSLDEAIDEEVGFFAVTDEQLRLLRLTMARVASKDEGDQKKVAKSSRGMTRQMTNFEAGVFIDFMDAIMNASTNKPEAPEPPLAEEAQAPLPEAASPAAEATN